MTEPGTHAVGAGARLRPSSGSQVPVAHAVGREIIRAGLIDRRFIERTTSGFAEYERLVEPWTVSLAVKVTGVPAAVIQVLVRAYALGEPSRAFEVAEPCPDGRAFEVVEPCPDDVRRARFDLSLLTARDHTDGQLRTPFHLVECAPPVDLTDERYPVRLTEGRRGGSSDTQLWRRGSASSLRRAECIELSPEDAERYGVVVGEEVRVVTRRGSTTAPVWVDPVLRPGLAFRTVRAQDSRDANRLAANARCPIAGADEFGAAAIRIEKRPLVATRSGGRAWDE